MIKLFRKIRYNLMEQNKTGKYFKYAIGEIILVVIGILIALQINNWNQNRLNSNQEQQILLQLKSEFKENLKELDAKDTMRKHMINSIEQLFNIKEENSIAEFSTDTLRSYIAWTNNTPTFDPVLGTTNELLSSGKLYLIDNNELKTRLTNWSGQVDRLREYEQDLRQNNINIYNPFLTQNFSIKDLFDGVWQEKEYIKNKENRVKAVKDFIENKAVDDYIFTIASLCEWTKLESLVVRNYTNEILKLIDQELDK
ncbi:DUF6090 family protein [Ichthyenterobacterium sp. W332]|uniref:DUF6090 family protein n=1 Tax=Microcosmobacter mediterraneus TaxID=3075607 RepID=A0ABU2YPK7_9FLAO|nr:DUF6090 family protein [Ichthyenterobacterium sp. W332]MDT0559634.1 DUF6090 family protein [Ichthyenterobacterium sp. W332]